SPGNQQARKLLDNALAFHPEAPVQAEACGAGPAPEAAASGGPEDIDWQLQDEPGSGVPAAETFAEEGSLLLREAAAKMEACDYQSALGLYKLLLAIDPSDGKALEGEERARE